MFEIERKFLLTDDAAQELLQCKNKIKIIQWYIMNNPLLEVRVRERHNSNGVSYKLALKTKGKLRRLELQKELSANIYNWLQKFRRGYVLEKDYVKNFYGLEASYVKIQDTNTSFCYAEKEFKTIKESEKFIPQKDNLIQQDITSDARWKMNHVAHTGKTPTL
jgi:CYTH domain-containing protein